MAYITEELKLAILALKGKGRTAVDVAKEFNIHRHKVSYIWSMAMRIEAKVAATKERLCLCCQKPFKSAGPHNRLCDLCSKQSSSLSEQFK